MIVLGDQDIGIPRPIEVKAHERRALAAHLSGAERLNRGDAMGTACCVSGGPGSKAGCVNERADMCDLIVALASMLPPIWARRGRVA